jgi:alkaline phosphatase D
MTRRQSLLWAGGVLAQAAVLAAIPKSAHAGGIQLPQSKSPARPQAMQQDPFSLGIASGDPAPDGFVLWTRLAPDPLSSDPDMPGGMLAAAKGGVDVSLRYEIAEDPGMRRIVRRGLAAAEAAYAHSVHLEVTGLRPGRPYWYRFMTDQATSPVGCVRTAAAPDAPLANLRFAVACCSNYEQGYFAAYRHLAAEAPDLVLFLGDYIYEGVDHSQPVLRRHSDGVPPTTLHGYRNRYAQYRMDADLQAVHAAAPALMTWDDHEVQNDYAGEWSETFDDPERFLLRRAAAYQAFYEHMPVRPSISLPRGPDMRIYDRFGFGNLVTFSMLDGRQYRSREACYAKPYGGGHIVTAGTCPELVDPARTMLGEAQEKWLYDGLAQSRSHWNIIGQDVLMASLYEGVRGPKAHEWTEAWDGYPACRQRLLDHIAASKVSNPVVFSGDNHAFWANDLKRDFSDPKSPVVATEFVATSITSYGPPYEMVAKWLPQNPHVHFFESRKRGYVAVDLTPELMAVRFQAISDAADLNATVSTLRSFAIESGRRGTMAA